MAYLLLWNPDRAHDYQWERLEDLVDAVDAGQHPEDQWTVARNSVEVGARFFMVRTGSRRGIQGSGYIVSPTRRGVRWDDPDREANWISIRFTAIRGRDDSLLVDRSHLSSDKILSEVFHGGSPAKSGIKITDEQATRLSVLASVGVDGADFGATEGDVYCGYRKHRRRERSLRRAKLDSSELRCEVCGFDATRFGDFAKRLLDVHHLDPITDGVRKTRLDRLAVVCPICHRLIHTSWPPLNLIEARELRQQLDRQE